MKFIDSIIEFLASFGITLSNVNILLVVCTLVVISCYLVVKGEIKIKHSSNKYSIEFQYPHSEEKKKK